MKISRLPIDVFKNVSLNAIWAKTEIDNGPGDREAPFLSRGVRIFSAEGKN